MKMQAIEFGINQHSSERWRETYLPRTGNAREVHFAYPETRAIFSGMAFGKRKNHRLAALRPDQLCLRHYGFEDAAARA